jgi:hypothetical protein
VPEVISGETNNTLEEDPMQSGNQIPELDDWERPAGRWVT